MKLLSICIPTYNRINELEKLLDSIEYEVNSKKLRDKVEICISDNASPYKVENLIKKKLNNLDIKFNRNPENMGFDYNLDMTTKLATGKYIWFCGDDDEILPNSLDRIIDVLEKKQVQIYILNGQLKDKEKIKKFNALNAENKRIYDCSIEKEIYQYINDINNNLSFFCAFITSIIVERDVYLKQDISTQLKNSAYDHMYKLLKILKSGYKLMYLSNEYYSVGITENDWNKERGQHFLLDITSVYKFIDNLYSTNNLEIRIKIGQLLNRSCGKIGMIDNIEYAKRKNKDKEIIEMMKYFNMYSIKNKIFKLFFSNNFTIKIIKKLRKLKRGI